MAEEKEAPATETPVVTAAGRYASLETDRSPYLENARRVANLTIPSLMPPENISGARTFYKPFQSVGARGVNTLAAKILLALFPPGLSFFKLEVKEDVLDVLKAQAGEGADVVGEVDKALAKMERAIAKKLDATNTRAVLSETIKHLVAVGNGLLQVLPSGQLKFYPLSKYVVKRDLEGTPLEIIVKEGLSHRSLSPEVRAVVEEYGPKSGEYASTDQTLDLYTWLSRKQNGSWRIHQEICGHRIPGTEGFYPADKQAWFPLRWTAVPGEDYGRGHGDEYYGDLYSLESLSQSIIEGTAAAAKVLWLVNEAGVTQKKSLEKPNNSIIDGDAKDVTVLKVDKMGDFAVAKQTRDELKTQLEQAFLVYSPRQAERVTAEEIRLMVNELEQTLGGVYSVLAGELQRPLVVRLMFIMQRAKELPEYPQGSISPAIITGLNGLGRQSESGKLDMLIASVAAAIGAEAAAEYIKGGELFTRKGAALSLDTDGLIRSEEEVQARRQEAAQAALVQKLGPNAIKAESDQAIAAQEAATAPQPQ